MMKKEQMKEKEKEKEKEMEMEMEKGLVPVPLRPFLPRVGIFGLIATLNPSRVYNFHYINLCDRRLE